MLAFIDIHKHVFQACVLDPDTGALADARFAATPEELGRWADSVPAARIVAVEATTGWRWVARLLQQRGLEVRLVDPGQAKALQGNKRRAKTDKLDCRWGVLLLAKEMLPEAWLAPAEIQQLRDQTRLRQALVQDRTRWAQRLHAFLQHEGWPVTRSRLLTAEGRRWVAALQLAGPARAQVDLIMQLVRTLDEQIEIVETQLRRFARSDRRTRALMELRGIGPILACILVAEIGDVRRFHRARQVIRAAGLDPVVDDSADTKRRGRLSKAGAPLLRYALIQAALQARNARHPDQALHASVKTRLGAQKARLTVARKIGHRVYHVLSDLEQAA